MTRGDAGSGSGRSRRRLLSDEDRRLWEHVVRSVAPRANQKSRVPDAGAASPPAEPPPSRPATTSQLHARLESGAGRIERFTPPEPVPVRPPQRHAPPPIADFDRKAVRRIRAGRIEIEARIDLHGMRQDEAHMTLRSFLSGCHARRLRWVLVITGKGRPERLGGRDHETGTPYTRDLRRHSLSGWQDDERGVLKRVVPRWLGEPELRAIVVSYTSAAPNHGGEGALYVQLRARR